MSYLRVQRLACGAGASVLIAAAVCVGASSANATTGNRPASGGAAMAQTVKTTATLTKPKTVTELGQRVLRQGLQGADVTILQGYLTMVGYPTAVDGVFGPDTAASVAAFKTAHAMVPANGVAGKVFDKVLTTAISAYETVVPTTKATINPITGAATAPANAPPAVKAVIAAGNQIIDTSYCYAGGHGSWQSSCYDCSGAVSYALHGGGLLSAPLAVQFEGYGDPGPGRWISVYADSQHVFAVIAGIAFDTADFGGPNIPAGTGPRWRSNPLGNLADGGDYVVRHPPGF